MSDYSYTKTFRVNYNKALSKEIQSSASLWAEAHTLYHEGNRSACQDLLRKNPIQKFHLFTLQLRILEIKVKFEIFLGDGKVNDDFIKNQLESSLKWIKENKKVSLRQGITFERFVKMVQKMVRIHIDPKSKDKKKVKLRKGVVEGPIGSFQGLVVGKN